MKAYYHPDCMFDTLLRSRATTKVIDSPDDIEVTSPEKHAASSGEATTSSISKDAPLKAKKEKVKSKSNEPAAKKAKTAASKTSTSKKKGKKGHVTESDDESDEPPSEETKAEAKDISESGGKKSSGRAAKPTATTDTSESSTKKSNRITRAKPVDTAEASSKKTSGKAKKVAGIGDRLCKLIFTAVGLQRAKSLRLCKIVTLFFNDKDRYFTEGYDGNLYLLLKFLIPVADERVYNLKAKQLMKIFSNLFDWSHDELTESYNQTGDVSQTLCDFFAKTDEKAKKSQLTNQMVDEWLEKLSELTREEEQEMHFSEICKL
ncbi:unnamed protein product [Gongylonema pulchrum]|uniref:DNA_ligase_A_N domain-containing protein n=1 Tax=Gongylonema pulchrum TaxID=637853 RepID=A0A183ED97_9BILA|nr:unnamed protein product [Gongylonema pulchrum]